MERERERKDPSSEMSAADIQHEETLRHRKAGQVDKDKVAQQRTTTHSTEGPYSDMRYE